MLHLSQHASDSSYKRRTPAGVLTGRGRLSWVLRKFAEDKPSA